MAGVVWGGVGRRLQALRPGCAEQAVDFVGALASALEGCWPGGLPFTLESGRNAQAEGNMMAARHKTEEMTEGTWNTKLGKEGSLLSTPNPHRQVPGRCSPTFRIGPVAQDLHVTYFARTPEAFGARTPEAQESRTPFFSELLAPPHNSLHPGLGLLLLG